MCSLGWLWHVHSRQIGPRLSDSPDSASPSAATPLQRARLGVVLVFFLTGNFQSCTFTRITKPPPQPTPETAALPPNSHTPLSQNNFNMYAALELTVVMVAPTLTSPVGTASAAPPSGPPSRPRGKLPPRPSLPRPWLFPLSNSLPRRKALASLPDSSPRPLASKRASLSR